MRVLLTEDRYGLGKAGEVVEVSSVQGWGLVGDGFARLPADAEDREGAPCAPRSA